MVKIISPYKNLGCLGFRISKRFYVDFFKEPYLGIFANIATKKIWAGLIVRTYMIATLLKIEHAFKNPTRLYWERFIR